MYFHSLLIYLCGLMPDISSLTISQQRASHAQRHISIGYVDYAKIAPRLYRREGKAGFVHVV